jgi:hypothetical protein
MGSEPEGEPGSVPALPDSTPSGSPVSWVPMSNMASAAAPRPPRAPGDTAPDFMLRAPASVTTMADDFFDGLIRPVDGER